MNLTPYLPVLEMGGLAAFAGGSNPLKAGPIGALLSRAIELVTHSKLSHVGIVPPKSYWPLPDRPILIESTIWQGTSGPQVNDLSRRLILDYEAKGGHAWFRPYLPQFEPDWEKLWGTGEDLLAKVKTGKLHYSVARLFGDAADRNWLFSALPVAGVLEHLSEDDQGLVCSECAGLLEQGGGVDQKAKAAGIRWLPKVEPVAGQAIGCAPQDLWEMPIRHDPITIL